jgi:hypothetical protein
MQGYYDLEVDTRYNDGECGQVKPVQDKLHFRFANGKYEQAK